jgi:hypothetical protein
LHRNILATATGMLRAPGRTWHEVTARWSTLLTPIAAAIALAFGMIAYGVVEDEPVTVTIDAPPAAREPLDLAPLLAPDAEAPPALLIDMAEPSREAVLTAALVSR